MEDRLIFLYSVRLRERDGFWSENMRERCLAYVAEDAELSQLRKEHLWRTKGRDLAAELKADFKKKLSEAQERINKNAI